MLLNQTAALHYIDVAQEFGLAGDVCPMPEAEAGVSIDDDAPVLGCLRHPVQHHLRRLFNGQRRYLQALGAGGRHSLLPAGRPSAPPGRGRAGVRRPGDRNAIAFIEEHTGEKWDWKHYFECAKRVNISTKYRQEWLDMNKTDYPQVFGSNLALYTETNYMAICRQGSGIH